LGLPDNHAMHLMIPYAASHAEGCVATLPALKLPHLQKLLQHLSAQAPDEGDEFSLSPPHERALARALGLPTTEGQIPWAARQAAQQTDLAELGGAWAFITLCNWQAHMKEVTLRQMPMQNLSAAESDTLLAAMQPFFVEDGITLYPFESGCWLARSEVFAALPTASPDRVQGRDLTPWMPKGGQAGKLMRLLSEMQMLLYTHPVNDARVTRGALPVNAFWLHGTGVLPALPSNKTNPTVIGTLRDAALREGWSEWAAAWQALDAQHGKTLLDAHRQGQAVELTLCGERCAQTWRSQRRGLLQKLQGVFGSYPLQNRLEKL
jgi:hypothetical protein